MAFDITFKSKLKTALGKDVSAALQKDLLDKVSNGDFFHEKVTGKKTRVIKIVRDKFAQIKKGRLGKLGTIKMVSGKTAIDLEIQGIKVRLIETGKKAGAGGGLGASDAKSTEMQEKASMWIIKRALSDNIHYKQWKDVVTDPKYREIVAIYPAVEDNTDWQDGFIAQHKKMLQVAASRKYKEFKHYSRDEGFMDFISKLIKDKFGISQKDTWNPADIWMVENQTKIENELKKSVDKKHSTVAELNEVMRKQFQDGRLIGISLKKISGKVAKWEEVNVEDTMFADADYTFDFDMAKISLNLKDDGTFTTTDTRVVVKEGGTKYDFQLRQNSPGMSNLKFEPTASGARAARLGKVPQDMLRPLLKEYKINFVNRWQEYPASAKEYTKQKSKYMKMFASIKNKVTTNQTSQNGFHTAMLSSFANDKMGIATSKLMQLTFLHELMKLSKKKRDALLTDMLFLAMKKGPKFGPFGKLY